MERRNMAALALLSLFLLRADMFQDAGNAELPAARTNLGLGPGSVNIWDEMQAVGSNTVITPDSSFVAARTLLDGFGGANGHAFSDNSTFSKTGGANSYNSFDAQPTFSRIGEAGLGGHYAGFQARPIFTGAAGSHVPIMYLSNNWAVANGGGAIDNLNYYQVTAPDLSNGSTVGNITGLNVPDLTGKFTGTAYGVNVAAQPSLFSNIIIKQGSKLITGALTGNALLNIGGALTTATNDLMIVNATLASSDTTTQVGLNFQPHIEPTGASLFAARGMYAGPYIDDTALNVSNWSAIVAEPRLGSNYTGTVTNGIAYSAGSGVQLGSGAFTNAIQYYAGNSAHGTGMSSGTRSLKQFYAEGAGTTTISGGALDIQGVAIKVAYGAVIGGALTYSGLDISDGPQGAASGGGTITAYSLKNTSTKPSLFAGPVIQKPAASVVPINNGELTVEATSNTQLTLRLKGSDGVVRSNTLTLAP